MRGTQKPAMVQAGVEPALACHTGTPMASSPYRRLTVRCPLLERSAPYQTGDRHTIPVRHNTSRLTARY